MTPQEAMEVTILEHVRKISWRIRRSKREGECQMFHKDCAVISADRLDILKREKVHLNLTT
jgi:hypothetical protein